MAGSPQVGTHTRANPQRGVEGEGQPRARALSADLGLPGLRTLPPRRSGKPYPNLWGLLALYLLTDWRRMAEQGNGFGRPGWFRRQGLVPGIVRENRGVSFRLIRREDCLACGKSLSPTSSGDHVVSRDAGGPDGAQNYMPLCGNCNSSKGKLDLLHWWIVKRDHSVLELPVEVLTAYARLTFEQYVRTGKDGKPIEPALEHAVSELLDGLPTPTHRHAMWERVAWVAGH